MVISVNVHAYIFGDKESVLCNNYMLNNKAQSIAYHLVREVASRDERTTAYMNTHDNPGDILMKVYFMSEKRWGCVQMLQHHIFGYFPEAPVFAYFLNYC